MRGGAMEHWILRRADAQALAQGYRELRLYTHETMTENIALYTRLGWSETHRGQQMGYNRVFMRKQLPPQKHPEESGEE